MDAAADEKLFSDPRIALLLSRLGRPPPLDAIAKNHKKHDKPEPQFRRIGIEQNDQQNQFRNQPGKFLSQKRTQCHKKSELH